MVDNKTVTSKPRVVFFENLDGVRAIAAFLVVVTHIQFQKKTFGVAAISSFSSENLGKTGVSIFFALSGFLISYLLLEERVNFKQVDLKAFYIRRILRIWPLYFLVIIVGFFIYPAEGSVKALLMSIFFMPNVAFSLFLLPPLFDPIWSIGTEEQFYMFHPHIFRIKKIENILYALVGILVGLYIFIGVIKVFAGHNVFLNGLRHFFYYARFTNMIVGAIVATLYYNKKHQLFNFKYQAWFDMLFKPAVQWLLLIGFVAFVSFFLVVDVPQGDMIVSLLASLIIVNLCETKTTVFNLKNKALAYCGKISYSIYLLHKFPLYLVIYLTDTYLSGVSYFWQDAFILVATLVLVVALGSASYYGYERYFLRLKARFQKIAQSAAKG